MSTHESFEQLCALAVTGDLEPEEFRRLGEHLYECCQCRVAYRDFHAIVERGFPVVETPRTSGQILPRFGMKRRFAARAAKEGLSINASDLRSAQVWRLLVRTTAATLFVLAVVAYGSHIYGTIQQRQREAAGQIALLSGKVSQLEEQLREVPAADTRSVQPQLPSIERAGDLDRQLSSLRNDYDTAMTEKNRLADRASTLSSELERLHEDSRNAQSEVERLQRNLTEAETVLARANRDLETLRNMRSTEAATIAQQQARLTELAGKTREQAEIIAREREMLTVGKDIRDLMGARNLRIVDVQDNGNLGRVRPLAGRIFYTQGKSLIFYAYDLQNSGNVSTVDFQVWGKREGRSQAPRSLGILYADEPAQNRWILKFEDPEVLAEIDQVFVTVEPSGGSARPTGKQLLTAAFLNESPNHP